MSRLYRRRTNAASVAVSNRRFGIEGKRRVPEPTREQMRALGGMLVGIRPPADTLWTLIRDGFVRPDAFP
jgi:hypothetical protein